MLPPHRDVWGVEAFPAYAQGFFFKLVSVLFLFGWLVCLLVYFFAGNRVFQCSPGWFFYPNAQVLECQACATVPAVRLVSWRLQSKEKIMLQREINFHFCICAPMCVHMHTCVCLHGMCVYTHIHVCVPSSAHTCLHMCDVDVKDRTGSQSWLAPTLLRQAYSC